MKLKYGSIKSKNYFKQLAVPFKTYADFERVLKRVNTASYTEKYQAHIPYSCTFRIVCVDDEFSKKIVLIKG